MSTGNTNREPEWFEDKQGLYKFKLLIYNSKTIVCELFHIS